MLPRTARVAADGILQHSGDIQSLFLSAALSSWHLCDVIQHACSWRNAQPGADSCYIEDGPSTSSDSAMRQPLTASIATQARPRTRIGLTSPRRYPGVVPPLHQGGTLGFAAQGACSPSSSSRASYSSTLTGDKYYDSLSPGVGKDILQYSKRKQTGISMKYILSFGNRPLEQQMMVSAKFLKEELPVRLAHRIVELNDGLPPLLAQQKQIVACKGWYADSFRDIRSFPSIKDHQDVVAFTDMLRHAIRRHAAVVPAVAKGVEQYKRKLSELKKARPGSNDDTEPSDIQSFLDTFFLSRIAIRFLALHHVALHDQACSQAKTMHPPPSNMVGLIDTQCSPVQVVEDSVADARSICFREYGDAPTVDIIGNPELRFAYVPSHLHHMVFELVKNSLRAVHDRYKGEEEGALISVIVAGGAEDITIKVTDQGGGISRSGIRHIWTYLYTTAKSPLPELDVDDLANMPAVLAGYGCGLPLTRLHSRYFGGDLQIISMEGFGTDAFLHLSRLGSDEEPFPEHGK